METQFTINGMTCTGCQYKVQHLLSAIKGVEKVQVNLEKNTACINASHKIEEGEIVNALKEYPKYTIGGKVIAFELNNQKTWWQTYKPVLLIFIYLFVICTGIQLLQNKWDTMQWMTHFMAGFFLVFSFFKLLNVKGFANSYAMYDIVAMRLPAWGYIYPFIELAFGLLLLFNLFPFYTNIIILTIMAISLIGVLQSVLQKKKIKCACLGDVFNLPMSTVTIIEDGLMIAMSLFMLLKMI